LINDIPDLSKAEAGKLELDLAAVNLRPVPENSLTLGKEKAVKKALQLSTKLDGTPDSIRADQRKLKQVLYNLLANAVKFTPEGGKIVLAARPFVYAQNRWASRKREGLAKGSAFRFVIPNHPILEERRDLWNPKQSSSSKTMP
jgi:hypothetical protein